MKRLLLLSLLFMSISFSWLDFVWGLSNPFSFFPTITIGKSAYAKEYIYKKYVPDREYRVQKDGSMLQYDYCNGCDDRPATDDEIESFWQKAHPEWYA